jgi:hypothetical protein
MPVYNDKENKDYSLILLESRGPCYANEEYGMESVPRLNA